MTFPWHGTILDECIRVIEYLIHVEYTVVPKYDLVLGRDGDLPMFAQF